MSVSATPIIPTIAVITAIGGYLWCARRPFGNPAIYIAVAAHAVTVALALFPAGQAGLGLIISLFTLGALCLSWRHLYHPAARRLILVWAILAAPMTVLLPAQEATPVIGLHTLLALSVYILMATGFVHWLDWRLHEAALKKQPQARGGDPLLQQEKRYFRYIALAFAVLTLTLISGGVAVVSADRAVSLFTHKNIFAGLTWLTLLVLLAGHYLYGWRGKHANIAFIVGYVFLLLSYIGSAFVLQVLLHR